MPDERESPSAGWREVCDEMAAATDVEEATRRCPDCDRTCPHVLRDVYECADHGLFRPNADAENADVSDVSDDSDASNVSDAPDEGEDEDAKNRLSGLAD